MDNSEDLALERVKEQKLSMLFYADLKKYVFGEKVVELLLGLLVSTEQHWV